MLTILTVTIGACFLGLFGIDFGDVFNGFTGGGLGFLAGKLGFGPADLVGNLFFPPGPPGAPTITPPPPAPDWTDLNIRQARISQRRRQMLGQGLGQTFFTGPLGDSTPPPTSKPTLGGY